MSERKRMLAEMPEEERPRERMLKYGPSGLSNAELLAILLNTGLPGESVMFVAERLLRDHGGFTGLMRMSAQELSKVHGVGPAKATKLKASMEIAQRVMADMQERRPRLVNPDDVLNLIERQPEIL